MAKGKEYELLIGRLYQQLEPNADIIINDSLIDRTCGVKRQIDVSIRYKFANTDYLTIIEAKDYKNKADVKVIDGFAKVVEDVGANKGIIICSKGFSKTAIEKARYLGIETLTIHSAENKDWTTEVKSKIKFTRHTFEIAAETGIDIKDLAGKQVKIEDDIYTLDKVNVISMKDVILQLILSKFSWKDITRSSGIKLNLVKSGLHCFFNDEFRPVVGGFIELKYKKSMDSYFYMDPVNYMYEVNHGKGEKTLHDLTYDFDEMIRIINGTKKIESFTKGDFAESLIDVEIINYEFLGYGILPTLKINRASKIHGNIKIKGNRIMTLDRRMNRIFEIEDQLKED